MSQRIGLLTLPLHTKYGGILQAVSLCQVLEKFGHEVFLLDRVPVFSLQRRLAICILRYFP